MKKIKLLILLLSPILLVAQVPDTETFSLQDVIDEVEGVQTSLQDCFDDANLGGFDPTYNNDGYAPANSLLRFRNYISVIGDLHLISVSEISRTNSSTYSGTALVRLFEHGTSTPLNFNEVKLFQIGTDNIDGLGTSGGYAETSTIGSSDMTFTIFFTGAISSSFIMNLALQFVHDSYDTSGSPTIQVTVPAF